MDLRSSLQQDLKDAIRTQDGPRKAVIRLCLAAVQLAELEHEDELTEEDVVAVLQKEARKRQETIEELREADRPDRLAEEEAELAILETYLPQLLSEEEITEEARAVIAEVGATGLSDLGRVMGQLMPQMRGRADGRLVNTVVRGLLSS